jgi:hypothetical protein
MQQEHALLKQQACVVGSSREAHVREVSTGQGGSLQATLKEQPPASTRQQLQVIGEMPSVRIHQFPSMSAFAPAGELARTGSRVRCACTRVRFTARVQPYGCGVGSHRPPIPVNAPDTQYCPRRFLQRSATRNACTSQASGARGQRAGRGPAWLWTSWGNLVDRNALSRGQGRGNDWYST